MSGSNILLTKKGKRRCLACWWESHRKSARRQSLQKKLVFIEAFNQSKTDGVTVASVSQLLEWSEKAQKAVKIAEVEADAAAMFAQQQDLRLFWATRKFQQAQERFEKIAKVANEISEARKLKAK